MLSWKWVYRIFLVKSYGTCGIQFQDSAVNCSKSGKIVREKMISVTLSHFKPKQKRAIFIHHTIKSGPLKSVVTQIQ
jgi:hypothetical protein